MPSLDSLLLLHEATRPAVYTCRQSPVNLCFVYDGHVMSALSRCAQGRLEVACWSVMAVRGIKVRGCWLPRVEAVGLDEFRILRAELCVPRGPTFAPTCFYLCEPPCAPKAPRECQPSTLASCPHPSCLIALLLCPPSLPPTLPPAAHDGDPRAPQTHRLVCNIEQVGAQQTKHQQLQTC